MMIRQVIIRTGFYFIYANDRWRRRPVLVTLRLICSIGVSISAVINVRQSMEDGT